MTHGSVTTTYSYDSHNQLLSATGTGTGATSQSYTYDGDGNLRTEDLEGTTQTMAYSSANELCWAYSGTSSDTCGTLPSGATKYYADADGNQTGSAAGLALSYNTLNQASSMTNSTGGTVTAMTYAGIGNTQRTAAGTTTFTNNSFGVASSTTSGATLYFTRDPSGTLNSMVSGGARDYYLYDGAGNIIGLFNNTGTQAATYSYDPYGNLINSSGTLSVTNPYRYAAGYTDHTGYDHFGARYYNPTLGAFTQTDPSGQTPDTTTPAATR
jgi:RHS repeat-associated protein